jgi:nucleotide-binding universal stress UspA family protein
MRDHTDRRPILIAYDGSDHAKAAISEAAKQLSDGRRAVVLTVWRPYSMPGVGGVPVPEDVEVAVEEKARRVADQGARLARLAGFEAEAVAERGDPVWQRIVQAAEERDASLVVMGSQGRTGISRVLMGSVASTASAHTDRPVLITHLRAAQA